MRGESKYHLGHMLQLALAATFSFGRFPVTLLAILGGALLCGSIAAALLGVSAATATILLTAGIQLLGLWVLGRYVTAIAEDVRSRPSYVISETMNLDGAEKQTVSAVGAGTTIAPLSRKGGTESSSG